VDQETRPQADILPRSLMIEVAEIIAFFAGLFRPPGSDETIGLATKPFFACRAELRKPLAVINP
jgi:hypothetical protein